MAEADLGNILEDVNGFGWAITVTAPDGTQKPLKGSSNDIGLTIDPDTGTAVSGRQATVTLRIASVLAVLPGLPVGISDPTSKPWLIQFDDINGVAHTFKVVESMPDRTLGVITCILELYQ